MQRSWVQFPLKPDSFSPDDIAVTSKLLQNFDDHVFHSPSIRSSIYESLRLQIFVHSFLSRVDKTYKLTSSQLGASVMNYASTHILILWKSLLKFAPSKAIEMTDSGFHAMDPRFHCWNHDSTTFDSCNGFQRLDSGFILLRASGFQEVDPGFQCPVFRISRAKISWIPESGLPYMGR